MNRKPAIKQLLVLILSILLCACATTAAPPEERHPDDPWEPWNRSVHSFNRGVDKAVLRPVAVGYQKVTPGPVQTGVSNFFRNLRSPIIMVNMLLQGRGGDLEQEFQRFFTNTVYGVGGLFDLADAAGIEDNDADLGQTLAGWGWQDSRFVMLPLVGPSTMRDTVGRIGDGFGDEAWRLAYRRGSYGLLALRIVDTRVGLLPLDAELAAAYDEYILIRDGWLQRRNYFIHGAQTETPDYDAWLDDDWEDDWED